MSICSQNTEIITRSNYNKPYSATRSCLPNGGAGFSPTLINTYSGVIDSNALNTYVETILPASIGNITNEYCFYYKRYTYSLQQLLIYAANVREPRNRYEYDQQQQTNRYQIRLKENTQQLNSILNQILQILQAVIYKSGSSMPDYYQSARDRLLSEMRKLENTDIEKDAKKSMLDYTVEKNSASRNLLSMYGFLNVVAIGMLVYLYRSSK